MKKAIIPIILALCMSASAVAAPGTAADPLMTVSYVKSIYEKAMVDKATAGIATLYEAQTKRLADAETAILGGIDTNIRQKFINAVAQKVDVLLKSPDYVLPGAKAGVIKRGDRVVGATGSGFTLISGSGRVCGRGGSEIINITAGKTEKVGNKVSPNIYYMVTADNLSGMEVTSETAEVRLNSGAWVIKKHKAQFTKYAEALKSMGLFNGTEQGFELTRQPVRHEALTMLIRMLGEEKAALAYDKAGSFRDLNIYDGGKRIVNYAESRNYAGGYGNGYFGPNDSTDIYMYLTFVLRALGYDDKIGDFVWNTTSKDVAISLGLLTEKQFSTCLKYGFMRDHIALISYNALFVPMKNGSVTLGEKLVNLGVITAAQLNAAKEMIK